MLYVYINQTCSRKKSYLRTINAAVVLKCDYYYLDAIYRTFD